MNIWDVFLIGVGLSMDAAAVSISNAICLRKLKLRDILLMCGAFAFFQFLMPVIGYYGGFLFREYIMTYDHWIALILLLFIGGKMIFEVFKNHNGEEENRPGFNLTFKIIIVQAIATSIDALAVGISFSALDVNIYSASLTIMVTTFALCLAAIVAAHKAGQKLASKAELIGGLILIGIGLKIFIEHLVSGS